MSRMSDLATELDLFAKPAVPASDMPSGVPEQVCILFERLALEIAAKGFSRYSARAVLHRIRWHYHVEKGEREFMCNNNWTPRMARWFARRHPELPDFFELRERRAEQ